MADIYFDVDAALAEVAVNALPIVDATTGATIKTDLAYNASGMALFWHFVTTAGAHTVTAVTPTTAGVHDWAAQSTSGIYTIEIPASGGTINNDTEGFGWFTGFATDYLPWRSPVYGFRAAALNNALIDGGDLLDVNVTHAADTAWGSGAITAASLAADAGTELADAIHDEVVEGSTTLRQMLRGFASALMGKASGLATTTAAYRDLADSKDRITATVDANGNRTAVTLDLT